MARRYGLNWALLLFICVGLLIQNRAWASYGFVLEIQDYAKEGLYYYPLYFRVDIQNTGTQPDTIDLYLTKNLPPGWFADFCVRGKCVQNYAYIDLQPGQRDSILVDIYLGGAQDVGTATLTGIMRGDPTKTGSITVVGFCAQPSMLLVDDDQGLNYQTYMRDAIQAAGYKCYIHNAASSGRPWARLLKSFWAVFWTTADGDASYIGTADESALVEFLSSGGNLFFASMNYLSSRSGTNALITDYLKVGAWNNDLSISGVSGVSGDPIGDGMNLQLGSLPFPPDEVESLVLAGSNAVFTMGGDVFGLRSSGEKWKVVFLSFPFEPILNNPYPNNSVTLISRAIDWFEPFQASVESDLTAGESPLACPNPFMGATKIRFGKGFGTRLARIYDTQGRLVRTLESQNHAFEWDGRDDGGNPLAPGLYFLRAESQASCDCVKIILLR